MLIGYARISKADGSQSLDLQRDALREAGVSDDAIYEDQASGQREDRPGLAAFLNNQQDNRRDKRNAAKQRWPEPRLAVVRNQNRLQPIERGVFLVYVFGYPNVNRQHMQVRWFLYQEVGKRQAVPATPLSL